MITWVLCRQSLHPRPYTNHRTHMSYSLNSLRGVIWGIIYGTTIGVIKGDTRSLDNGSYDFLWEFLPSSAKPWKCTCG